MADFHALAEVAATQHATISLDQLDSLGYRSAQIKTMLADGFLTRGFPRVLIVSGSPQTWRQRLMAACLSAGPSAVAGHRSAAALWSLAGFRPGGTMVPGSPFELRVERLLRSAGLPAPSRQHRVHCGPRCYVVDLAWPQRQIAVACDGWRHHASASDQTRDSERRDDIEAHGWSVLNLTWEMLRDRPSDLVAVVRRHLAVA